MVVVGVSLPWSIRSSKGDSVGASWLLGVGGLAVVIGMVVWLLAGTGFIGAAIGFWQDAGWRHWMAWVGAVATLLALGLWAGSIPTGAYVGGVLAAGTIAYLILR
jgi:hypothetical protein